MSSLLKESFVTDMDSEDLLKTLGENGFSSFINFDDIEFDSVIGTGGYSDVYKAKLNSKFVALKKFA